MSVADILNWANTIPAWMEDARCTGGDIELWYSSNPYEIERAKRICVDCPVRQQCLEFALENNEKHGVWAGYTPVSRARMVTKAKRGNDAA